MPVDIQALLDSMTLREKVGQLNQRMYGWDAVVRVGSSYELTDEFHAEVERWGGMGALYGLFRADAWSGRTWQSGILPEDRAAVAAQVQAAVGGRSRAGIRTLIVEEAPHGHQALGGPTAPVNLNIGATWDPDLYAESSAALATVLRASGVHLALVSALDLLRDPRWGRSEECFGEDPLLASAMTTAVVRGMQGDERSRLGSDGVGVVLKHFAGQGEGLGGRNGHSAVIGPRDLAELHLPAARAGVDAGAVGLMGAYNDIDGLPCCSNRDLLTRLLREEWGFDGLVMADGKAIDRLAQMTGSLPGAALLALTAGIDLSLWDQAFTLLEDVAGENPTVTAAIDLACSRVLGVKAMFGLLDAGEDDHETPKVTSDLLHQAGRAATETAAESLVLLANRDAALPLQDWGLPDSRSVVLIGPNQDSVTAMLGDYVPPLQDGRSVLDAARDERPAGTVRSAVEPEDCRGADTVLCVLGGTSHRNYTDEFADNGAIASAGTTATCGEGVDLADLALPGDQAALVASVRAVVGPSVQVIAVVIAGRPHLLGEVIEHCDTVLWAGYPGPEGASVIMDALTGRTEPRGRLPFTLPATGGVLPVRYNDRHPGKVQYVDAPAAVLRPFAFGLGYSEVTYEDLQAEIGAGVTVRVMINNPNPHQVTEIVPLFAHRVGGSTWPRQQELVAFRRVVVPANSTQTVEFELPADQVFADTQATGAAAVTTLSTGPGHDPYGVRLKINR